MSEVPYRLPAAPGSDVLCPGGLRQLLGLDQDELAQFLGELGEPAYRSRQLFRWLYGRGVTDFADMTDFPLALRQRLAQSATVGCVQEVARQEAAPTATRKFLFALRDGEKVESVLMRHDYGYSVCISSQVGCRMGCTFCASGIGGLVRNLSAGEIVDQVLRMGAALPAGERIARVVFMGSGEPLENLDEVLKAIRLLHDPEGPGIGHRHMTISTSGPVPFMRQLTATGLPITLALSLHAPNDDLRSQLMPVNRIWPVAEVMAALREHAAATGRRVTIEYILIEGINDTPELAMELAHRLRGLLCHVNLIPMNPVAERPDYRRPSGNRVHGFRDQLAAAGINATFRREMGGDIDAACGQLRNRVERRHRLRSGPALPTGGGPQ